MANRTYTDEERKEALVLYEEHGPAEAGRRTGIPSKTISSWANKQGLSAAEDALKRNQAARDTAVAAQQAKRERLRELLLTKAVDLLEDMDKKVTVVLKSGDKIQVAVGPDGKQKLATASAILIDKLRLELGEATERREDIALVRNEAEGLIDKFRTKPQLSVVKDQAV